MTCSNLQVSPNWHIFSARISGNVTGELLSRLLAWALKQGRVSCMSKVCYAVSIDLLITCFQAGNGTRNAGVHVLQVPCEPVVN